uniref:Uncharacterized protein n=1 Tax=Haplochromis burtoni TaxID=8153 RepID=A0A3Q2WM99_HAPBU
FLHKVCSTGHCEYIREMMKEFWECNEGSIDDVGLTWDAFKAYLRGHIIQYSSLIKKAQRDDLLKLEQDIKELEKQVKQIKSGNLIPSIFDNNNKLTTSKKEINDNWVKMNLFLLGRINLVKMIIAPKFQYFLHMVHIAVLHSPLKLYNTCVEDFVCAGKKPSFNRSKLYAVKDSGGLTLSKMVCYHYAFSLSQLVKINNSYGEKLSWKESSKSCWCLSHHAMGTKLWLQYTLLSTLGLAHHLVNWICRSATP